MSQVYTSFIRERSEIKSTSEAFFAKEMIKFVFVPKKNQVYSSLSYDRKVFMLRKFTFENLLEETWEMTFWIYKILQTVAVQGKKDNNCSQEQKQIKN